MWDYEYALNDLNTRAYLIIDSLETFSLTPEELEIARAFERSYRGQNPYSLDARLDISASLKISENITVSAYILNLLATNKARRYTYDDGLQTLEMAPELIQLGFVPNGPADFVYSLQRLKFIEEPTVFGARVKLTF